MLSAGWLVYALVTGTLVALACRSVDALARAHRVPSRWTWALGLGGMLLLGARSLLSLRALAPSVRTLMESTTNGPVALSAPRGTMARLLSTALAAGRGALDVVIVGTARVLPAWLGHGMLTLWLLASVVALVVIALVHRRITRVRRAWPRARLHGHDVRISPAVGPAVLGVVRPFIVVPRWLLGRSEEEQRLVLAHEAEHLRTGDHLLLAGGTIAAALVPWHPAGWWMLSRLRLAIELDCDARVLRRGVGARAYGTLLIDLAGQCTGFSAGATALADEPSHLERRLLAMRPTASRITRLRTGALLGASLLAGLAACEAKLPTSAEVQTMDVASAEKSAQKVKVSFDGAEFVVDGRKVTAEEAHAIPANRIASVDMQVATGSAPARVVITTGAGSTSGFPMTMHMRHASLTQADSVEMAKLHTEHVSSMSRTFDGLILIDGVKSDNAGLSKLGPNDIASIAITKGAQALAESSEPAAANGIIRVTTKAGAARK